MNQFIASSKKLLRKYKRLNRDVFAIYLQIIFFYETIVSFTTNLLIVILKHLLIKGNVTAVVVKKSETEISYLDKFFYWDPADRTSLLGLIFSGTYETNELKTMMRFIKPGMTVFDVGANFGFYSMFFADKVGPNGHTYCFEPLRQTHKELVHNIQRNNFTDRVTAENLGLSDKGGIATMYIAKDLGSGATSLQKRWYGKNITNVCRLVTLDWYIRRHNIHAVDFIKCDVEGAELLVFTGAKETIKRYRPILFFESIDTHTVLFNYTREKLISFLEKYSYDIFLLRAGTLEKVSSRVENGNYLALPKKRRTQ